MENQFLDSQFTSEKPTLVYASFGQRLAAVLIDGLLLGVVSVVILYATGAYGAIFSGIMNAEDPADIDTAGIMTKLILGYGIMLILQAAYYVVLESGEKQGTLGKQAMSIIVTDMEGNRLTAGKALIRFLVRILPAFIPFIGSLYTLVDGFIQLGTPKKQTLHDMAAGTLVYQKPQ